ncbi:MAG: VOC family protein, partial [Polaromonas sp.]|nr:VOC family protein [Polaromonas sp.]
MSSPWIRALRSVTLDLPDLAKAEAFYTDIWKLSVVAREPGAIYLRGTGPDHHLLAIHQGGAQAQIRHVTLRARSLDALSAIEQAAVQAGGRIVSPNAPLNDPAGGTG